MSMENEGRASAGRSTFTCAACGGVFDAGPEDEAEAEYQSLFPAEASAGDPRDAVCDGCHLEMAKRYGWPIDEQEP